MRCATYQLPGWTAEVQAKFDAGLIDGTMGLFCTLENLERMNLSAAAKKAVIDSGNALPSSPVKPRPRDWVQDWINEAETLGVKDLPSEN